MTNPQNPDWVCPACKTPWEWHIAEGRLCRKKRPETSEVVESTTQWDPSFDYLAWLNTWAQSQSAKSPLGKRLREAVQHFADTNEALGACQSEGAANARTLEWLTAMAHKLELEWRPDESGGEHVWVVEFGNPSRCCTGSTPQEAVRRAMAMSPLDAAQSLSGPPVGGES